MDEDLLAQIREKLGGVMEKTTLFTLKSKFNSRLNAVLLKFLVNEKGMKGVCVSLDRPSFYMQKILSKNGVNLDNLIFLDTMANISGDYRANEFRSHLVKNPFPKDLVEGLREDGFGTKNFPGIDFVIIDNAAVLSCYIDNNSIEELLDALCNLENVRAIMSLDKDSNSEMYERLRSRGAQEFEVAEDGSLIVKRPAKS